MSTMNQYLRSLYNKRNRKRLKNHNISLIASNCTGGVILHDLGLRYHSPFVNLWMKPKDFIIICQNLREYMDCELEFIQEEGIGYPVGLLNDVRIYFQHYETEDEARTKWEQRKKRLTIGIFTFCLLTETIALMKI